VKDGGRDAQAIWDKYDCIEGPFFRGIYKKKKLVTVWNILVFFRKLFRDIILCTQ